MTTLELLSNLSSKDIEIWADGDRLRFNAPKGALTPDLRKELAARKSEILALLRQADAVTSSASFPLKPVSRAGDLPLSFAQQRLWFLNQLGTSSAYNIRLAIRLKGSLNTKALEDSLNEIIQRHEALRTTFRSIGGRPVQVVTENISFEMPLTDLSWQQKADREAEAGRIIAEKAICPFNLTEGPLIRAKLLCMAEEEHILLLTMHHIVSDGWSMAILTRELTVLYEAFCNEDPSPLPELPIHYADFAYWQREWLQGEVLENQLSYWREQLEGVPVLQLFTDRPRPAVQTFEGASQNIALSPTLTGALNDLSQRQGVTLFMTLLAAFQTLLFRYTGQEDIVVGSPIANRNRTEIEGLIGFFVNSLAMRTDLSGNPSFRKLLRRLREVAFGAYAHQDLPFEKLVEELNPERDMSRTSLFQIMFALQNMPAEELQLPGLTLSSFAIERITVRFDIEIYLWEKPEGLSGKVVYNTDLFDDATIGRLMGHYETLLEGIVTDPDQRISDVQILSDTERQQLLVEWNNTSSGYPDDRCVHQLFEQQVEQSPDAVAVVYEDEQLTYRQLNTRANQLAHYITKLGVGPEVLVGICLERSLEMVVGVLGILKAGGAYVPLDPTYPKGRLAFMLSDAQIPILLTQKRLVDTLPVYDGDVICLDNDVSAISQESEENPASGVTPADLVYVIYTSGSTGRPKGVLIPHRALMNHTLAVARQYGLGSKDRVLQFASICFDLAAEEIFPSLLNGATVVLRPNQVTVSFTELLQFLEREKLTVLNPPTAYWHEWVSELSRSKAQLPHTVRLVIPGGEKASKDKFATWQKLVGSHVRWINGYGPTEATITATNYEPTLLREVQGNLSVPIGRPIANTRVYIFDPHMQPVPIGVAGELYIGGDGLARGYLNRPELTAEKFIPDPFSEDPAARLYKTGDLARYLQDGSIEFLGRIDHQIKIRGFRIELGEVENVLGRHPAVEEAVVIAREDVPGDKRLVAYVVSSHEPSPTFSELRSFLKEKLPDYMIPTAVVFLDLLPITPNGKVDRRALPAPDVVRPDLQEAFVAPRSQSEELVAGIWSNLLGVERIGVYDSFFELGGHSLLVVQIVSRLREVFEVELAVRTLFEAPTVAGLTERIEAARSSDEGLQTYPLQAVSRDQDLPLSFAQERLWFLHHLEPDSVAYSMPRSIRLKGVLRKGALQKTYVELARRHETLRTTFHSTDGNPVQRIAAEPNIVFDTLDLRHLPEVEREAEVKRLREEDARKPFDLRRDPLFRIRLFQLEDEAHVLHSNMHHIISDGWSFGVMEHEIVALYSAFIKDKPADLPELPVQYADYAVWQRQWFQGEALEAQLNYWKDKLGGELPVLELPTDRPRPAVQTHRGAMESLALPKELTDALQAMSRREGVTLFMTLLAAFKTLLYRLTGQEEIIVGTPIAGRNRVELEGLIGFFMNTIVMRTDLSGNPTFRELLGRVRETALGAFTNQDMPFERLVEELAPERDLSRTPLFQVFFNHLVARSDKAVQLPGLEAEAVGGLEGESKFDMTLTVLEGAGSIELYSSYNTDLFDSWRIAAMLKQYQMLLASIVSDSDQRISELLLLTEAERHQILVDWNATAADYPEEKCIHELFENQVEDTPDAIAVIFGKQRLTYRELNTRANQLAHYLHSQAVVAESRVGIWMERSLDMMVALLGTLKAGGAYVPLDPSYPQERLAFMLSDSQVSVLLTMEKFLEDYPAYAGHVVCLDRDFEAIAGGSEENPISDITADSAAYVIYTSGSTGTPKGVIGLHRGAVNRLSWMWRVYPFKDGEVCCQKTYLSFVDSVWEIFGPLLKGVPTVIIPEEVVKDPHLLVDNLAAAHVSRILLVPSLLRVLLDSFGDLQKRLFDLKTWVSSGEEISVELARRFGQVMPEAKLINLYGSSEVSADVTCYEVADGRQHRCIPIGRPIDNTSIYILDSHQQSVPIGVSGELYIGGVGMARGYLNQPDLTAERFIPSPFGQEEVLFKTGDLGRYLPDGNIEYLGRRDHQVKVRGFRIELGEIESQIKGLEAVSNSVVVLREDRPADQRLTAYYVCKDGQAVSESEVRRQLQTQLPEYMLPQHFVELESIPLTPNGKVDRKALPKPDTDGASEQGYVAPRTEAEQKIAAVWQEVLNSERVGVNENFFKLGGHSLLATQVMSRINRLFNIQLPLRRLFEARTVGALAEYINSEKYHVEENPVSRISREGELSVSFSQERLWFLTQLEPGDTAYHISAGIRLEGQLRVDNLEQSLTEIVGRHEALRTTFEEIEGQPVQVISPPAAFDLPVLDLEALPEADRAARLQQIIADETRRPFDLSAGLLFRAVLVRLGQQEYVLVLVMHHIITDGWSLGVFTRELESLYSAFCEGRPSPLAELAVQYADYAAWQRERLQGEVLDTQVKYWKQKLGEELPILQLSTDRPRPAIQTHHGARHGFDLPEGLSERIEDLSRQQGVTLYMMLLAAFKVLLYRYTGQADFGVGSPIANRTQPELEGLIGFFVNTLVLRTDMSGDPGFIELLSRVRETTLGAFDHQELPFEKLVEVVNPAREMSYSPLFQVMFVLQNMPGAAVQLPGLKLSSVAVDSGSAMFDLTLFMRERDQGLSGSVEYNTDLFDAERIERMVGHFQTLLEGIVADPEKCLSELALLPQAERQQLLVGWNDTVMDYPKDKCIHELFEHQVNQTPDAIAVACKNEQITYDELNIRANQLAHFLNELGVGPQVVVGLCAKRSVELVIGLVGILKAGGIYLPLDSEYPEERLLFMLEDSRAQILLTDKNAESVLSKSNAPIVCLESNDENLARHSTEDPISCVKVDTPAYLIYTSGSTGNPKGVLGLQRGLLNRFNWMWQAYPFEAGDVCCQKTSISFVDSIWEILGPLLQGIKTVIISDGVVKEPRLLIKYLADEQVTRITMVPSYLRVMLDTYSDLQARLPKLKLWISSGEALSKELSQRFREKLPQSLLLNLYGSSEVSADVTWYDTNSTNHESPSVPIGRPIANTQVYILDPYLQSVPTGVPGELHIGGENLAAGYLNQSELTESAFISDPFSNKSNARLFKTGDKGRWLPDGNIEFLGRVDHQVKIRGFRIEPGEVEAVLNKHPDVKESIVVAPEDRPNDKRLVAYVILKQTQVTASQELHRFVKQRLPAYMVPSAIVFLNALPLTPSGKVDRRALPAPDRTRSQPVEALVAPRDELELQLTQTWEKVLGVQPVGVHDNFFELGGHSLLAVRLMAQIEKIHGENLPLATLFQAPTVEQLASILHAQGWSAPSSSLEAIEIGGAGSISIGHKIARHIPAQSHPYLKQQYLKVKQHPGYRYLKRQHYKAKSSFTKRFLSYRPARLEEKLRAIGLAEADTVYMHSAFKAFNGFSGGPQQIIDCILNVIGSSGNLLMVSMAYTRSTEDYLKTVKTFDVTKTESSMGIITEIFRRKKDVVRSLNPAHPILAFGPDAQWIISDHDKTLYSCGKGSPFEKILELNAKALFFDVPFRTMTFFHYLEDTFKESSPVKLYDDEPLENTVIDSNGNEIYVKTNVFSQEARKRRSAGHIEGELRKKNLLKTDTIGNTKLAFVNLGDVVGCAQALVNTGIHFYN